MIRLALIGCGAIGRALVEKLEPHQDQVQVVAVLMRPGRDAGLGLPTVHTPEEMLESKPTLIVECAGHAALREHAIPILESGVDLIAASVGALADADFEARVRQAAQTGHSRFLVPSGAMAALDALASAKLVGLEHVEYTSRKPPRAWLGTPAEHTVPLETLEQASTFFSGSAREAALGFPQNANVAAAIALAGIGFDRTRVHLIADPHATGNTHHLHAKGTFGCLELTLQAVPLADNPKSSALTASSLARSVLHHGHGLLV